MHSFINCVIRIRSRIRRRIAVLFVLKNDIILRKSICNIWSKFYNKKFYLVRISENKRYKTCSSLCTNFIKKERKKKHECVFCSVTRNHVKQKLQQSINVWVSLPGRWLNRLREELHTKKYSITYNMYVICADDLFLPFYPISSHIIIIILLLLV